MHGDHKHGNRGVCRNFYEHEKSRWEFSGNSVQPMGNFQEAE